MLLFKEDLTYVGVFSILIYRLQITYQLDIYFYISAVRVEFEPANYTFNEGMGPVTLTLVVSGLVGAGILECDVNVSVLFTDGPKASKFLEGYISLVLLPFLTS